MCRHVLAASSNVWGILDRSSCLNQTVKRSVHRTGQVSGINPTLAFGVIRFLSNRSH